MDFRSLPALAANIVSKHGHGSKSRRHHKFSKSEDRGRDTYFGISPLVQNKTPEWTGDANEFVVERNKMLDRLLADFNEPPPPVPSKDGKERRMLKVEDLKKSKKVMAWLGTGGAEEDADRSGVHAVSAAPKLLIPGYEAGTVRDPNAALRRASYIDPPSPEKALATERVTAFNKRFTQDDSGILTPPPPARSFRTFEEEMGSFSLSKGPSPFDPPPAPRTSRFDINVQEQPKKKPAPLNLNARTSQTGQWTVHTVDDIPWVRGDDALDTAGMLAATSSAPRPKTPSKSIRRTQMNLVQAAPKIVYEEPDSAELASEPPSTGPLEDTLAVSTTQLRRPSEQTINLRYIYSPTDGAQLASEPSSFWPPRKDSLVQSSRFHRRISSGTVIDSEPDVSAKLSMAADSNRAIYPLPYQPLRSKPVAPPSTLRREALTRSPAPSRVQSPPSLSSDTRNSVSPIFVSPPTPATLPPPLRIGHPGFQPDSPGSSVLDAILYIDNPGHKSPLNNAKAPAVQPPAQTSKLRHRRTESAKNPATHKMQHNVRSVSTRKKQEKNDIEREAQAICQSVFNEGSANETTLRWLGLMPRSQTAPELNAPRVASPVGTDRSRILGSYFHRPTGSVSTL